MPEKRLPFFANLASIIMNPNFPLGHSRNFVCWRMLLAYMMLIVLLPTGLLASVAAIAQITPETAAEQLAGKPLSYWLIALAAFCGTTFTLIVKWLLAQLESQRTTNAASNTQLLNYLKEDRVMLVKQLTEVAAVVSENSKIIRSFQNHGRQADE